MGGREQGHVERENASREITSSVRVIRGDDGRQWMVREVAAAPYDRRRGPSLIFMTDDVMRRVREYPPDWFERTEAELFALSLRV